jgi:hypothetical protein
MGDFSLPHVSETQEAEKIHPHPPAKASLGIKVLPPYTDSSHQEVNLEINERALDEALAHAPHAELHREVSSANHQLRSMAKTVGNSIVHGLGRSGAFIAGMTVAAATKVITFSSCLATGGVSGLIMIPAAGIKAMKMDERSLKQLEQRIEYIKADITRLEIDMAKDKSNVDDVSFPEALKEKMEKAQNYKKKLQKEIASTEVKKEKLLKKMEKKKTSEWNTTAGKIRIFHHAGMKSARLLEPVSDKLIAYALGKPNEKLNRLNTKADEVLGKSGTGIGVATGSVITTAGLSIGAIVGSFLGCVFAVVDGATKPD